MGLTVEQINKQEFSTKMRGYNQNEVQQFMATVAQTVQELTEENHALKETVKADEGKLKYFSELKDSLNKSILVAQEAADKVKNNAKREADIMIREAQKQATDIVSEANEKANQVVERSTQLVPKLIKIRRRWPSSQQSNNRLRELNQLLLHQKRANRQLLMRGRP